MTTTYPLTGANRGIGRAFADILLLRPSTTLIALVLDPDHPTSLSLQTQPRASDTKLITLTYDAASETSAKTAISTLESTHSIFSIDVVITNAGGFDWSGPSTQALPSNILETVKLNTLGPFLLFVETIPFLLKSTHTPLPKFIAISSQAGSISSVRVTPRARSLPYGMSKAALNYLVAKLHCEYPGVIVEALTPGATKTGLGPKVIQWDKIPNVEYDVPKVARGLLKCIDEATKGGTSGGFRTWKGEVVPW